MRINKWTFSLIGRVSSTRPETLYASRLALRKLIEAVVREEKKSGTTTLQQGPYSSPIRIDGGQGQLGGYGKLDRWLET